MNIHMTAVLNKMYSFQFFILYTFQKTAEKKYIFVEFFHTLHWEQQKMPQFLLHFKNGLKFMYFHTQDFSYH